VNLKDTDQMIAVGGNYTELLHEGIFQNSAIWEVLIEKITVNKCQKIMLLYSTRGWAGMCIIQCYIVAVITRNHYFLWEYS